jgi:hypothetical protein
LSHEGQTRRQKHKPDELPHDSFLILKSRDGVRLLSDLLERENPLQTLSKSYRAVSFPGQLCAAG